MDVSAAPDVTFERLHEIADAFARRDVDGIVNASPRTASSATPVVPTTGARASRARPRSAATSNRCSPPLAT